MKKLFLKILCSTALTLILLGIIGTFLGAEFLLISSIFESLAANIIIHLGFIVTNRFESKYTLLESALDIGYAIMVLTVFGFIFNWYSSTPIWILIFMAVLIYFIGLFLNMCRVRKDVKIINGLLQERNKVKGEA